MTDNFGLAIATVARNARLSVSATATTTASASSPCSCNNKDRTIQRVIYNPPCTILIMSDKKKYISRIHNEPFDKEKGLLMCIAKAYGVTHSELKRLIANAQNFEPKCTE